MVHLELSELQRNWDGLAKSDPLWAILADPTKTGGRWDPKEFFVTGYLEIDHVLENVRRLAPGLNYDIALDFGCGVGRLSLPLSEKFGEVYGVDISPTMVELARKLVARDNCRFEVNAHDDLQVFDDNSFDFICSLITLQHMRPRHARKYIVEFLRILAPGGVAFFNVPDSKPTKVAPSQAEQRVFLEDLRSRIYDFRLKHRNVDAPYNISRWLRNRRAKKPHMEMFGVPKKEVEGDSPGERRTAATRPET
jgi:ubiquinone/menaquinone biosynthesis C-methylase UbiE